MRAPLSFPVSNQGLESIATGGHPACEAVQFTTCGHTHPWPVLTHLCQRTCASAPVWSFLELFPLQLARLKTIEKCFYAGFVDVAGRFITYVESPVGRNVERY